MSSAVSGYEIGGWAGTRKRVLRNKMFVAGLIILGTFAVLTVIHPVLQATVWSSEPAVYHPQTGHDRTILHPSPPSLDHVLGTDPLGRDVLSLVTYGLRPSFVIAVSAAVSAGIVGLVVGTSAAYFKGRRDRALTHIADAFAATNFRDQHLLSVYHSGKCNSAGADNVQAVTAFALGKNRLTSFEIVNLHARTDIP